MKDYSKIATKYGVIGCYIDTSDFIESYKINRENNYVEIKFTFAKKRVFEKVFIKL
jgi:hypothetical protein